MISSDICSLHQYLLIGHCLKTAVGARSLWDAEQIAAKNRLRIDFTGLQSSHLSKDFINELFRLHDENLLNVPWLIPINYDTDVELMLKGHFLKLRRMREASLLAGFRQARLIE